MSHCQVERQPCKTKPQAQVAGKRKTNIMTNKFDELAKRLTQAVTLRLTFLALLALLGTASASAQDHELWVDASRGNDGSAGTAKKPLQTLGRAIAVANGISAGTVDIKLRPGTYPV